MLNVQVDKGVFPTHASSLVALRENSDVHNDTMVTHFFISQTQKTFKIETFKKIIFVQSLTAGLPIEGVVVVSPSTHDLLSAVKREHSLLAQTPRVASKR